MKWRRILQERCTRSGVAGDTQGHRVADNEWEYFWLSSIRSINIIATALKQIDYLSNILGEN